MLVYVFAVVFRGVTPTARPIYYPLTPSNLPSHCMSLVPERTDRAGDRAGGKKDGSDFVGTDGSEKNPLKSVRSRKIGSRRWSGIGWSSTGCFEKSRLWSRIFLKIWLSPPPFFINLKKSQPPLHKTNRRHNSHHNSHQSLASGSWRRSKEATKEVGGGCTLELRTRTTFVQTTASRAGFSKSSTAGWRHGGRGSPFRPSAFSPPPPSDNYSLTKCTSSW